MSATVKIATIREARSPRKATASAEPKPSARALARYHRHAWAHTGIGVSVVLSALLNSTSSYHHAPQDGGAMAILVGVVIPCVVYILARVAGTQYTTGARRLAIFTACMGAGLLGLSVHHCGDAISMLTGMHWCEGILMAIAIDGGLVACELETLRK